MAIIAKRPKILAIFHVIIIHTYNLFILLEFEIDRLSLRESAKNGQIGAHGLNCKIVNSEVIFEIYDKFYHRKKNHVSTTLLKFS